MAGTGAVEPRPSQLFISIIIAPSIGARLAHTAHRIGRPSRLFCAHPELDTSVDHVTFLLLLRTRRLATACGSYAARPVDLLLVPVSTDRLTPTNAPYAEPNHAAASSSRTSLLRAALSVASPHRATVPDY